MKKTKAVMIEKNYAEWLEQRARKESVEKGQDITFSDYVRIALEKTFPMPKTLECEG